jgi:hypothetical protein
MLQEENPAQNLIKAFQVQITEWRCRPNQKEERKGGRKRWLREGQRDQGREWD